MRSIGAKDIVIPCVYLDSALLRFGQHRFEYVKIAMVRSFCILEDSVGIELRMRRGKVAAVEFVVFLFPMVWKRPAFDLPSAGTPVISKGGQKQSVHLALLLKNIQYLVHALIHERYGADLNSNHLLGWRRCARKWGRDCRARPIRSGNCSCDTDSCLYEIPACGNFVLIGH